MSISVGCNNTCTFCIVPALRGKEKDRRPGEILAEVEALVAEGVTEITLLGQNVNAYGVEFGDRQAFSKLLRACGEIEGLERVRFTSPHPAEFTDDVIEAMAETPNVMPSLHMPLQSGSDKVLRDMRRSYRQSKYLGIIERVRAAIPDAAITTDIIVGFPGETEEDFQATLDVVRAARFSAAFTFQYSKRPGTPAAILEDQVSAGGRQGPLPAARRGRRGDRLGGEQGARRPHRRADGRRGRGPQGRSPPSASPAARRDNRLVHFAADFSAVPEDSVRPGDMVTVEITYAAPHHLVADGAIQSVRRTRAGDAWERRTSAPPAPSAVGLGMPSVGVPAPLPPAATPAADGSPRSLPLLSKSPLERGLRRQRGAGDAPGASRTPHCSDQPARRHLSGHLGHAVTCPAHPRAVSSAPTRTAVAQGRP